MKKIVFVFFFFTLLSCSNDDTSTIDSIYLKELIEVSNDTWFVTKFSYRGDKIASISDDKTQKEFIYTGDLITNVVQLDKESLHESTVQYEYNSEAKLVKVMSSDGYVMNFIHNNDGTVSYEKLTDEVLDFHGVMTFKNGNLTKDERVNDKSAEGILEVTSRNFSYDTKKNPLNNILGFSKLLDYHSAVSVNNFSDFFTTVSVKDLEKDQEISSMSNYKTKYRYNSSGYPIEVDTNKPVFGEENSKHNQSIFRYE